MLGDKTEHASGAIGGHNERRALFFSRAFVKQICKTGFAKLFLNEVSPSGDVVTEPFGDENWVGALMHVEVPFSEGSVGGMMMPSSCECRPHLFSVEASDTEDGLP